MREIFNGYLSMIVVALLCSACYGAQTQIASMGQSMDVWQGFHGCIRSDSPTHILPPLTIEGVKLARNHLFFKRICSKLFEDEIHDLFLGYMWVRS